MNIQVDRNYRAFKLMKGNRPIVPGKIKKLVKSVEGGLNLFQYCPILVNEQMFVIDGQHRLEACKVLKLPVHYVMVPKITLLQIAELNACASRWSVGDFFNCFIETGNKDYEVLQEFMKKYNLNVSIAVSLLMSGSSFEGSGSAENFREGKFKVLHKPKAEKIMRAVNDYAPVTTDTILRDKNFIRTIQMLMQSDLYTHEEIIAKLVTKKLLVLPQKNYKSYIFHIEELYNRSNSIRKVIYQGGKRNKKEDEK